LRALKMIVRTVKELRLAKIPSSRGISKERSSTVRELTCYKMQSACSSRT
jgi:hypothetical protein